MSDHSSLTMQGLVPILFGHAAFQQLNAGCELGLFEFLQDSPGATVRQIAAGTGLSLRSTEVLLLGTTSLGLTTKHVDGYHNCTILTDAFGKGSWPVLRDIVEFQARIAYLPAADYVESLDGVDYSDVDRILDVGGGDAVNAIALASAHPHLRITVLDRPSALDVAKETIAAAGQRWPSTDLQRILQRRRHRPAVRGAR